MKTLKFVPLIYLFIWISLFTSCTKNRSYYVTCELIEGDIIYKIGLETLTFQELISSNSGIGVYLQLPILIESEVFNVEKGDNIPIVITSSKWGQSNNPVVDVKIYIDESLVENRIDTISLLGTDVIGQKTLNFIVP
tara:strand:+ start:64 stop:474 length:411 start_codon:yes stop_codon:yes gene_type:complete